MTGTREDRGGGEAHVGDVLVPPEWSDWALRHKNSDINTVLALVVLVRCFLLPSYVVLSPNS